MFFRKYFLMNEATDHGTGGGGSGEGTGDSKPNDNEQKGQGSGSNDVNALPEWAQKELKDLRGEAGKYRTQNKTLSERLAKIEGGLKGIFGEEDDDQADPGEKLQRVSQVNQTLEVRNAMLQLALENGIGMDNYEFFEFKMGKALEALEEGQEMSEEQLAEIISGVKVQSVSSKGPANSTTTKDDQKKPADGSKKISQEEFNKMGIMARSKLFQENKELYNELMSNAKL
jgi:hypothetical protein